MSGTRRVRMSSDILDAVKAAHQIDLQAGDRPSSRVVTQRILLTVCQSIKAKLDLYALCVNAIHTKTGNFVVKFTDATGTVHNINVTPSECKRLLASLSDDLCRIPRLSHELTKRHRNQGSMSGFLCPHFFNDEIVSFISSPETKLGNVITGSTAAGTRDAIRDTLVKSTNPLRNVLALGNSTSLLVNICSLGDITPLLALHAYYSNMSREGKTAFLSCSSAMRKFLPNTLKKTIEVDVANMIKKHPQHTVKLTAWKAKLVHGIVDASINQHQIWVTKQGVSTTLEEAKESADGTEKPTVLFNPNCHQYSAFAKIISNGQLPAKFTQDSRSALCDQIEGAIDVPESIDGMQYLLDQQKTHVSLANEYMRMQKDATVQAAKKTISSKRPTKTFVAKRRG